MRLSDCELVKEVARNIALQYFLRLQAFQPTCQFKYGVMPMLRKRFGLEFITKINENLLKNAPPTPAHEAETPPEPTATGNLGTMIFDATCSPSNIRYPQDFSLLNETREKLDAMIDKLQKAKSKKCTDKQNRTIVHSMLNAVKREPWIC